MNGWLCSFLWALVAGHPQAGRRSKAPLAVSPELLVKAWQPFPSLEFAVEECTSRHNRTGRCLAMPECRFSRGIQEGHCADGFGVCCVYEVRSSPLTTSANNSYFVQPRFPRPYLESGNLSLTTRLPAGTCQVRVELERFQISDLVNGSCTGDYFQVFVNGSDTFVPRLCGRNDGQHVVLQLPSSDERSVITLKMSFMRSGYPRQWAVRIVQIKCGENNGAPGGCLQYHTTCRGTLRSFGFSWDAPGSLQNLNYGICIARPTWLQLTTLRVDVLEMESAVGSCHGDFLQLPAGRTGAEGAPGRPRICYANTTVVIDLAVQGPLVFYVLTSQRAGEHRGFSISYSLYPCS